MRFLSGILVPLLVGITLTTAGAASLQSREDPTPGTVHRSPNRRFAWIEGSKHVSVQSKGRSRKAARLRLPPAPAEGYTRRLLFPPGEKYFCVIDEKRSEVGLHLRKRRGARGAKAMILASKLHLLADNGRTLWSRTMPESHAVGAAENAHPLSISPEGTLAVLLQDVDPYTKARPVLLVLDPRGQERLRLDYTEWKHIDEFVLSENGRFLAVRGFGRIPDMESWGKALGFYRPGTAERWVRAVPRATDEKRLSSVDPDGRVCCVKEGGALVLFDRGGNRHSPASGGPEP